jgi:hypothetical protein
MNYQSELLIWGYQSRIVIQDWSVKIYQPVSDMVFIQLDDIPSMASRSASTVVTSVEALEDFFRSLSHSFGACMTYITRIVKYMIHTKAYTIKTCVCMSRLEAEKSQETNICNHFQNTSCLSKELYILDIAKNSCNQMYIIGYTLSFHIVTFKMHTSCA